MDDGNIFLTLDKKIIEALLDESKIDDFYKSLITRLSEAILEIEGLAAIGGTMHKNLEHYIDMEMHETLFDMIEQVTKKRLQRKHGVPPDVDNVAFLEAHPLFQSKKKLDNE